MNGDLIIAFLCLAAAVIIGAAGILIDRPEKPEPRPAAQHSKRGLRRAARAAERAEDDQTVAWLAALKRPLRRVPAQAIARARVAGLLAVLPARRAEPPCPRYAEPRTGEWPTTPGPWDTDEARAELVPLPPMPADLGDMAARYADLFDRHGPHPRPAEPTVVELTVVDAPPAYADELGDLLDMALRGNVYLKPMPGPNAAAGNWTPRAAVPDFDPAADPPGWGHLRYSWADQIVADFDSQAVAR